MRPTALLAASAVFLATVSASLYASLVGDSEIVHFWVAAPAGHVRKPRMMRSAGRPMRLEPIVIDLDRRGFLKRLLQPDVEGLSTHWISNVGKKPVRIQMDLVNLKVPVKWKVNANFPYDPRNRTFTRPLMPGQSIPNLGVDWLFEIPPDKSLECKRVIYDGGLKLTDADTGEMLTFIPIKIGRGIGSSAKEPPECKLCPRKPREF